MQDDSHPFLQHFAELRKRVIYIVVAIALGCLACLYFSKDIYMLLSRPLLKVLPGDSFFVATHVMEGWLTYLKVGFLSGFFLAIPVIFWQIWAFLAPGLYVQERRRTWIFAILSSFCFIGGALFGYFVVFPLATEYFAEVFTDSHIKLLPKMSDYYSFASRMLLAFGVAFELPILVYFLASSGLVSIKALFQFQRYVVVIAFIVGAALTPPDVISQILLSIPLLLLYQIGLFAAWLRSKVIRAKVDQDPE